MNVLSSAPALGTSRSREPCSVAGAAICSGERGRRSSDLEAGQSTHASPSSSAKVIPVRTSNEKRESLDMPSRRSAGGVLPGTDRGTATGAAFARSRLAPQRRWQRTGHSSPAHAQLHKSRRLRLLRLNAARALFPTAFCFLAVNGTLPSVWNVSQATPCGSSIQYLSDFA